MSTILSTCAAHARKIVAIGTRRTPHSKIGTGVVAAIVALAAVISEAAPAAAQFVQQGSKLVGSNYSGSTILQGYSVALSTDGNTAIVGGSQDNNGVGAAWVFTRSDGTWSQQGAKLTASDETGDGSLGRSVALSADGNTALVGGNGDNANDGAAWVFTRSNGVWTEQAKLVGTPNTGPISQGNSVGLSADGNTAIVGGPYDNSNVGAAWIFTRSDGAWTQQTKLVGSGYTGEPDEGFSVALSADGNTAILGGFFDNGSIGAAWVFSQNNGVWNQQGAKLTASDETGSGQFGWSVALSGDGNTAIVGGDFDNDNNGAAWVFTRSDGAWTQQGTKLTSPGEIHTEFGFSVALSATGNTSLVGGIVDGNYVGAAWVFTQSNGVWSQEGSKLVGIGNVGMSYQGISAELSADGNTAIVGGSHDNNDIGAAWVFARTLPTNTHDFNDDGVSDILWRDNSDDLAVWLMSAGQESSGAGIGSVGGSWSVVGTRDFNGDGNADILWLDGSGDLAVWLMNGATLSSGINLGNVGTQWQVAGTGDFNGDGTGDILWRNSSTGDVAIWLMSNGQYSSGVDLGAVQSAWQIAGTGDFNGDGTTDILWHNTSTGDYAIWLMSNGQMVSGAGLGVVGGTWSVVGTGDFNGDGTSDILWHDISGDLAIWLMNNGQFSSGATIAQVQTTWSVVETGDFNGDGKTDILWLCTTGGGSCSVGDLAVWLMNGTSLSSGIGLGNVGSSWTVQGQNAD